MNPDGQAERVSFTYVPEDDGEPVLTIVRAVSWFTGCEVRELTPLHDAVDTTSLEGLFDADASEFLRGPGDPPSGDRRLRFEYEGCEVFVEAGRVVVTDA